MCALVFFVRHPKYKSRSPKVTYRTEVKKMQKLCEL